MMVSTGGVDERVASYRARDLLYRRRGLDRAAAARFVVEAGGVLRGPALDVGTGKGLLAIELARTGLDVVSVDINAEEQEFAGLLIADAGIADRIELVHCDAARLSYPDAHFGSVAMMDFLHHLDEPAPVLREVIRVLAVDGLLVAADFDEAGFDLVETVHAETGRHHFRSATTLASAVARLTEMGLETVTAVAGQFQEAVVLRKTRRVEAPK